MFKIRIKLLKPVTTTTPESERILDKEVQNLHQKEAIYQTTLSDEGFYSRLFLIPQCNAPSFRFKFIKQLYRKQTFSGGKFVIDQNATQSRRLDDQIRLARGVPYSCNRCPVSKNSLFYFERQNLPVPSSSFRAEYNPISFHSTSKASSSSFEKT